MTQGTPHFAIRMTQDEKRRLLASLSEDEFRDRVVRPLFFLQGFRFYKDNCGPDEEGKDGIFILDSPFGQSQVHVVQTKRGNLNMSSDHSQNVITAITQLRTARETEILLPGQHIGTKPDYVYLFASGQANSRARQKIHDDIDREIKIFDVDDVIALVDEHFVHFWHDVHHLRMPYLRQLREHLLSLSDAVFLRDASQITTNTSSPISDEAYVEQTVVRFGSRFSVRQGFVESRPRIEEVRDKQLLSRQEAMLLITGEGGSGKTTMVRRLALQLCESALRIERGYEKCIPVVIKARLATSGLLEDSIRFAVSSMLTQPDSSISDTDFAEGNVFVFVDGLDEIADDNALSTLFHELLAFHERHPLCKLVLTSREKTDVISFAAANRIPHFRIADFSIRQASRILDRVSRGDVVRVDAAKEVLRRLHDVHGLKLNPLLVTAFAASPSYRPQDIPPNLTQIFKKFTALMLGQWDDQKGLAQQYDWELKHTVLVHIGYSLHSRHLTQLEISELEHSVRTLLADMGHGAKADDLLKEILDSGLISVEGSFASFRHHVFQEYFAGNHLETFADFEQLISDPWWRNAIVFSYGNRPARVDDLLLLRTPISKLRGLRKYDALITVGFALQACFMGPIVQRDEMFEWIITEMGRSLDEILVFVESSETYPMSTFIHLFLVGRGAVGSDLARRFFEKHVPPEFSECTEFWTLVGMMEAGHIEASSERALAFAPSNPRLLLAVDLMCFFIMHIKIASPEEKHIASVLEHSLRPRVQPLVKEIIEEYKGMLLELRQGTVTTVDAPVLIPEADVSTGDHPRDADLEGGENEI